MKKLIKKIAQGPITFLQRKVENVFYTGSRQPWPLFVYISPTRVQQVFQQIIL